MIPRVLHARGSLLDAAADVHVAFAEPGHEARAVEGPLRALVAAEIRRRGYRARAGAVLAVDHGEARRRRTLVLAGLGEPDRGEVERIHLAAAAAAREAAGRRAKRIAVATPSLAGLDDQVLAVRAVVEGVVLGTYRFERFRANDDDAPRTRIERVVVAGAPREVVREAGATASATAAGVALARDLVNAPPADADPAGIERAARAMAAERGLRIRVLGRSALEREKMGALLAVGQGSDVEPRLVHVAWRPGRRARRRLAFVGKGITFDSGGYDLKSPANMLTMKCDMAGGAAVLGAVAAVAGLDLPVEVHAVVPLAENLVSGGAYKPGDVLRSRAGRTIEINNTDAEGRLALADALDWTRDRLGPDVTVDVATLTGACVVALGPLAAGLMTPDDSLADDLLAAARRAGEKLWRLPLYPEYEEHLKSDIADMRNTGKREGGALTAGLFLRRFAGDGRWAHLDIAGPAFLDSAHPFWGKGGTGAAVLTLVELARRSSED